MPVMDTFKMCAEKMGYRLDVPIEFAKVIDEAYDSVFEDEENSKKNESNS